MNWMGDFGIALGILPVLMNTQLKTQKKLHREPESSAEGSSRLVKGGLVVLDPVTGAVKRTIALQYNPDSLTRSYQMQGAGGDGGAESAQPFRLKGPAPSRSSSKPRSTPPILWSIPTRTRMP